jgi:hypothetical protein
MVPSASTTMPLTLPSAPTDKLPVLLPATTLQLKTVSVVADNVLAGFGPGGIAQIGLQDSTASVLDSFRLINGELSLDDSFMSVVNVFTLGSGATLAIDVDGLLRGFEYAAIDAGAAFLDGVLTVDLGDLALIGDLVFDLIRSGDVDGIQGDFTSFLFTGLQSGYTALAGIEIDGDEVYRLRVQRVAVPEPSIWLLLVAAFPAILVARRRFAHSQSRCCCRPNLVTCPGV